MFPDGADGDGDGDDGVGDGDERGRREKEDEEKAEEGRWRRRRYQKSQRPLECLSESTRMNLGQVEASWVVLGPSSRDPGASWGILGAPGSPLELLGDLLAASWAPVGRLLGPPGGLFRPSWGALGSLGGALGALLEDIFFSMKADTWTPT